MMPHVHLAGWQKIAWALDEDLRWARAALDGRVRFTSLPRAGIVLAAWWPALEALGPAALRGKSVVCFADNPPAFYLTRPGFAKVADRVDLWIARSSEAVNQFQALGLPVARVPYCVDPDIFRPLDNRAGIRRELGLAEDAFVIGNFHRDSEGADLSRPKVQKGADLFLEIARALRERVPQTVVLLAGPRRHYLLRHLEAAGVPVCFAGEKPGAADDYARNILDRPALNRLYQALDVCVVSSRWEGGPYSVLETVLSGRPVISTPVGMPRDVVPASCLFETPEQAVTLLERQARDGMLDMSDRAKIQERHSLDALRSSLTAALQPLPQGPASLAASLACAVNVAMARLRPPVWTSCRQTVAEMDQLVREAPAGSCFYAAEKPDRHALAAAARGIQAALDR
jgi:glycosyltransferase involved in cell wall biosynthesis